MKNKIRVSILFCVAALICVAASAGTALTGKVTLIDGAKASALLMTEDRYTKLWCKFDIASRAHSTTATRQQLFELIGKQVREWTPDEKKKMNGIIKNISGKIEKAQLHLNFLDTVFFIKSTCAEESGAEGYTRENYVVLSEKILDIPQEELEKVVAHELFHVLSRNNPGLRKQLYAVIGFRICNEVPYPPSIADLVIHNPDSPTNDCFITVTIQDEPVQCTMIIYSEKEYTEGDFFAYAKMGLLRISGDSLNKHAEERNGKAVIYDYHALPNFYKQVGKNTEYDFQPEEILAENFVLTLNNAKDVPSPWVIEKIRAILKE